MSEIRIEYVKIETLIPYANNARKHGEEDTDAIMASIKEFGFTNPILVWKNIICAGHGRLIAAKRLGMDKVPVIHLDYLTDEQRKAYILADNKTAELSGWDFDILAAELEDIADIDMSQFGFEYPEENEGVCDESEEVLNDNPTDKLPKSRVIICSVSLFGTATEKIYEFAIEAEDAEAALKNIKEKGAEMTEKLREVLGDL